jgi:hypothetical protein
MNWFYNGIGMQVISAYDILSLSVAWRIIGGSGVTSRGSHAPANKLST